MFWKIKENPKTDYHLVCTNYKIIDRGSEVPKIAEIMNGCTVESRINVGLCLLIFRFVFPRAMFLLKGVRLFNFELYF